MELSKMKSALQDLIVRLQDAEKGYMEIKHGISNTVLMEWMTEYAEERHKFHRELEEISENLGGDPEVKTSFLGDMHRMFMDMKFNHLTDEESFDSIVNEIERGASVLIDDYKEVLDEIDWPSNIEERLRAQKEKIEYELDNLTTLREELTGEPA